MFWMKGVSLWMGNLVYLHLTVAFIQMLKAFTPVITMVSVVYTAAQGSSACVHSCSVACTASCCLCTHRQDSGMGLVCKKRQDMSVHLHENSTLHSHLGMQICFGCQISLSICHDLKHSFDSCKHTGVLVHGTA